MENHNIVKEKILKGFERSKACFPCMGVLAVLKSATALYAIKNDSKMNIYVLLNMN